MFGTGLPACSHPADNCRRERPPGTAETAAAAVRAIGTIDAIHFRRAQLAGVAGKSADPHPHFPSRNPVIGGAVDAHAPADPSLPEHDAVVVFVLALLCTAAVVLERAPDAGLFASAD